MEFKVQCIFAPDVVKWCNVHYLAKCLCNWVCPSEWLGWQTGAGKVCWKACSWRDRIVEWWRHLTPTITSITISLKNGFNLQKCQRWDCSSPNKNKSMLWMTTFVNHPKNRATFWQQQFICKTVNYWKLSIPFCVKCVV